MNSATISTCRCWLTHKTDTRLVLLILTVTWPWSVWTSKVTLSLVPNSLADTVHSSTSMVVSQKSTITASLIAVCYTINNLLTRLIPTIVQDSSKATSPGNHMMWRMPRIRASSGLISKDMRCLKVLRMTFKTTISRTFTVSKAALTTPLATWSNNSPWRKTSIRSWWAQQAQRCSMVTYHCHLVMNKHRSGSWHL